MDAHGGVEVGELFLDPYEFCSFEGDVHEDLGGVILVQSVQGSSRGCRRLTLLVLGLLL